MIIQAMILVPELQKNKDIMQIIQNTLQFLIDLQDSKGSFPTTLEASTIAARQFQWCHGAPGAIPMFISAAKLFQDDVALKKSYIEAATKAGEGTFKFGLLKKGNGLCHGISGNGYMLHSLTRYFIDSHENP